MEDEIVKLEDNMNSMINNQTELNNQAIDESIKSQNAILDNELAKQEKEATKQSQALYKDYQKNINMYGGNREQEFANGLNNTGYSETVKSDMYNAYQKANSEIRSNLNTLRNDYALQRASIISEGNVQKMKALAESYTTKLNNMLTIFNIKTNQQQFDYQKQRDSIADSRWQKEYENTLRQQELENMYRQQQFDYQKQRDSIADSQWQQQFDLQKKKSSSSGSSRSSSSKSSSSSSTSVNNNSTESQEEVIKRLNNNITIVQGPGVNSIKDKTTGKTYSSYQEYLKAYGFAKVE